MANRYFIPPAGDRHRVTLQDEEAHHLLHVVRASVGDRVTLFDGQGTEYEGELVEVSRRSATVEIVDRRQVPRQAERPLHLAVALPKGDRQRWLVEKLVELGVSSLIPLRTRRGVALPTAKALQRLERYVIEACKQCGRSRLMQVAQPLSLPELFETVPDQALRLIAHPDSPQSVACGQLPSDPLQASWPIYVAIGPEGGFADDELAAAQEARWQPLSLGPTILRVETAAIAVAARLLL